MEDKKITIRHFLNKRLKPELLGKDKYYPLYTQVTYDRKNTQFKMNLRYDHFIEEGFEGFFEWETIANSNSTDQRFLREYILKSIEWREKMIEFLLKHEVKEKKNQFVLKGFGKRFSFYETDLWAIFHTHSVQILLSFLLDKVSLNQYNFIKELNHFVHILKYINSNFPRIYKHLAETLKVEITCFHLFYNFVNLFGKTPKLKSSITEKEREELNHDLGLDYGITLEFHVFEWIFLEGRSNFKSYCNTKIIPETPLEINEITIKPNFIKIEFPSIEEDIPKYIKYIEQIIDEIGKEKEFHF